MLQFGIVNKKVSGLSLMAAGPGGEGTSLASTVSSGH